MNVSFDEHREFLRVEYAAPVHYKEVRANRLLFKNEMLTRNISPAGILFRTKSVPPALSSTVWIELDQKMMNICSEIEHDLIVRDQGIFGRVVRIAEGEPGMSYDVGICFLRRKSLTDRDLAEILPDK